MKEDSSSTEPRREGINLRGTFLWVFNLHPSSATWWGEIAAYVAALSSTGIWGGSDLWCETAKRTRQVGHEDQHSAVCHMPALAVT